jgi:hypothetical protein
VRLRCVGCRAVTSIFGRFAGLGVGPVRVSCPFGFVLACVCVIEQVGGVAGQYNFSSIFCSCFGGYGTIEMAGYAVFKISLSSVCC